MYNFACCPEEAAKLGLRSYRLVRPRFPRNTCRYQTELELPSHCNFKALKSTSYVTTYLVLKIIKHFVERHFCCNSVSYTSSIVLQTDLIVLQTRFLRLW
ncbi:hypothetical protein KC19_2G184300 [Ceratodon purpureus]|uniref:Uncharacterized protein n=1 Tax=Ceratodon purpureus TaxID=3225 RepID=A0A8T0IVE1_CERPU|nr:hypothetical protein KC19_2G184300 [Ceratodon purpureus]